MKKIGILNSEISSVISKLGHTDMLVISDAGLPVPVDVKRIDLAVVENFPKFFDVLDKVLIELEVEKVIIAKESGEFNINFKNKIMESFKDKKIVEVKHTEFKELTKRARAVIRTGEVTPYANVILVSGVTFFKNKNS
jgi:D-ribose pyranase